MSDFNYKQWIQDNKVGPYRKVSLNESHLSNDQWLDAFQDAIVDLDLPIEAFRKIVKSLNHVDPIEDYGHMNPQQAAAEYVDDLVGWTVKEDTYTQTYDQGGPENPQPEDEQFQESMHDLYHNPGDLNFNIAYYSNAELDADNDVMPSDYSVPNPGLGADRDAAWKPKPFNNGKRDYSEPHKYGW